MAENDAETGDVSRWVWAGVMLWMYVCMHLLFCMYVFFYIVQNIILSNKMEPNRFIIC